ncbi:MAG: cytochrome C [Stygiobacter sp. RIFOXYC12_FULL_38_8]|nr:MAG: cytochrome C [Stygiobacter sp. GWC2_38_9]OGV06558.1 MAG: cytochrome C [Stygiobacter sp. RIFOXYB2_FULL_37_11]OGV13180.1 MAG: cytochrome C [Stygiobacter sp. RIFOXYC2_FULL_38_25]OGV14677.1 MAG: cytochrome C [Stygiobacter sp. RIFOXYA2_FULL_38_8]OGV24318.1 MAG: cytochrome C [Stygiobacter sp. RIFOXYC12_FULL_38_8]OGV83226.1 MAG: cytochrome C [Stygiobacter sp. GWF2_38_21]RJQ58653.1 MAG: cytochrome C [Stygiobacter sp.]
MCAKLSAQISPGDLSTAHSNLEGMSNCTKCHNIGGQVRNNECLACHTEISQLQKENKGFHSSSDVRSKSCIKCHSEHHGRKFRIVNFNPKTFDHSKTSFQLTGKHAQTDCFKCHTPDLMSDAKYKKNKGTFLGLKATCVSCHQDSHQGSLGNACQNCHEGDSFRPASKFKHNSAKFDLTGAHQRVDCAKCHAVETRNEKRFQKFKGVEFSSCTSCHQDFHKGKFGDKCSSCHVTESFHTIKNLTNFDHAKTNYPLLGKHTNVDCKACHKNGLNTKPKFEKCINCHSDYHQGEFTKNGTQADCAVCHSIDGFNSTSYTIERHIKSNFILTGAHLAIPCQSCHKKTEKWNFKIEKRECTDCHKDIHGGSIPQKLLTGKTCESCHTTEKWKSVTFDHNTTKFLLLGNHQKQSCNKCHVRNEIGNRLIISFKRKTECLECHNDVHAGQFTKNGIELCRSCHQFNNWKPELFDHNKTSFPLDGAHSKVSCNRCHKQVVDEKGKYIKYKFGEVRCALCHS